MTPHKHSTRTKRDLSTREEILFVYSTNKNIDLLEVALARQDRSRRSSRRHQAKHRRGKKHKSTKRRNRYRLRNKTERQQTAFDEMLTNEVEDRWGQENNIPVSNELEFGRLKTTSRSGGRDDTAIWRKEQEKSVGRDSDVYFPYQTTENISQRIHSQGSRNLQNDLDELIKSKRKVALWIVGNCGSTPGARARMKYSEQLVKAGLDLDRRGGCFPNSPTPPPKNKRATPSWDNFLRPYKFYMAFENAFSCNDYITEKFFRNSLSHGLVPVVLGAKKSDYEAVSPNHSFIYADDFENAEKLVEYLRYLDGNDTAYREYLAWRTHDPEEMPYHGRAVGLCQLCRILHGINVDNKYDENFEEKYSEIPLYGHPKKPRIVHSLRNWFYGNEDKKCISNY